MSEKGQRQNRFNSFELCTDDESNLSQTSLKNTIIELQQFFPEQPIDIKKINDIVDESVNELESAANEDDTLRSIPIYNIKFLKKIRQEMQCIEILKVIRSLLEESRASDEIVNWDLIVKDGFKVDCYLSFIYILMKLFDVDCQDKNNKDLSFNAGRTYMCLLGLPGAKRCLVWDPDLVITYFKLLNFHNKLKSGDHYLEIQMIQMLNECKIVFNIVCLDDQEEVLEKYIETLSTVLENYMISNSQSAVDIVMCCYDNLENLCLRPLPDKDIENIMYIIFCRTVDLHFITPKRRSSPKCKHGEAISDFFLHLLSAYSMKTKNVLLKFIKSLLSNPEHKFDREKFQKLMDVAVKYELAIYWKCNESIIEYLEKLSMSSDHRQRLNGVEFAGRMLLINTTPDAHTVNLVSIRIPREVYVIKILFERTYDKQDNVKLKALTSIKSAILNGNEFAKKIFHMIFKKTATSNDNPEILSILGEEADTFQQNILALLQTSNATYIKKACLEILSEYNISLMNS